MSGKPYRSKLKPYEGELYELLSGGTSYRKVAERLNEEYGLDVTHNAVFSYVNAKSRRHLLRKSFLAGLDQDIRNGLLKQLVALWTYDSTALEGNTLTLGETMQVLEFGLTISGKPLKDHQEVYGHAKAIDIIMTLFEEPAIEERHLFDLHKAVMPKGALDIMNPIGAWKQDRNGTTGLIDGKMEYIEYAAPPDVPKLMTGWLKMLNRKLDACGTGEEAIEAYATLHMGFVRIHPFFDGNGRMARLLANLPVLRGGFPPIVIAPVSRSRYINALWEYQLSSGTATAKGELPPAHKAMDDFELLLSEEWQAMLSLVEEARRRQDTR